MAMDRYVADGESLQQVLNDAHPGDTITLQAGATFTGSFILPVKSGSSWITIQSSLMNALPTAGQRVSPSHAPLMARILSPNAGPALTTAPGAHHYRIMGLELASVPGVYSLGVLTLGSSRETTVAQLPYSIEIDRVYIHGDPRVGGKRGIALNSRYTNISNSYISDFKSTSQDAQAICGWNGAGPFQITNNYLEASAENIMFGGGTPAIPNLVPSDIVIKRNHLYKPLSWYPASPLYTGTPWMVKNSFELKNARRVTIDGNIFEHNWGPLQHGFAINFTVRTESGKVLWAVIEDVLFTNNIVRNAGGGLKVYGAEAGYVGAQRITVRNNLFEHIDGPKWQGKGRFIQILDGCRNIVIDHNTSMQTGDAVFFGIGATTGFVYRNNISPGPACADATACGSPTFASWAPASFIARNAIAGVSSGSYPAGNYYPASVDEARFVNAGASNYTLAPDSPYRGLATDGKDLGVEFTALTTAINGSEPPPTGDQISGSATFLTADTATGGSWKSAYGADGFGIANDPPSYPAYVTVTTQNAEPWTWSATTTEARALQKNSSTATDRLAACWYTSTSMDINLTFNDRNTHRVAIYLLDWDRVNDRTQKVEILDASNTVLDSRTAASFTGGQYLVWNLSGEVKIRITNTNALNAVVSGIFFGDRPAAPGAASFVRTDTATAGSWKAAYGTDGYNVINSGAAYPSYVTVTPSGHNVWTWDASTTDTRALQKTSTGAVDRLAACWYSSTSFSIDLAFQDGLTRQIALYLLDWDRRYNRTQRIDILDSSNKVLDSRTVSAFGDGKYLVWNVSGRVTIRITNTNATNAVLSGLFFR